MSEILKYPRVSLTTQTIKRSTASTETEDTTVLFASFISEKGPTKEIKKIHSLSEFISIYGEADFDYQGQNILNIINWLNSGGTVYAYRLCKEESYALGYRSITKIDSTVCTASFVAKFPGVFYNNIGIRITKNSSTTVDATIGTRTGTAGNYTLQNILESYKKCTVDELVYRIGQNSQYIKSLVIDDNMKSYILSGTTVYIFPPLSEEEVSGSFEKSTEDFSTSISENSVAQNRQDFLINKFFSYKEYLSDTDDEVIEGVDNSALGFDPVTVALGNTLDTKISVILDAGFSLNTKNALIDFFFPEGLTSFDANTMEKNPFRNDIVLILDDSETTFNTDIKKYYLGILNDIEPSFSDTLYTSSFSGDVKYTPEGNISVYTQRFLIEDSLSGKDI